LKAVSNVNTIIGPALVGKQVTGKKQIKIKLKIKKKDEENIF
jgi:enolase